MMEAEVPHLLEAARRDVLRETAVQEEFFDGRIVAFRVADDLRFPPGEPVGGGVGGINRRLSPFAPSFEPEQQSK